MDDLSGLDWSAPSSQSTNKPPPLTNAGNYTAFRANPPLSGRSTPSVLQPQTVPGKHPGTPGASGKTGSPQNDSFANLLPFNSAQTSKNLSLKEQQDLLQEQKRNRAVNEHKQWDAYFGSGGSASVSAEPSRTASPSGFAIGTPGTLQSQNSGQRLPSGLSDRLGSRSTSSRLQSTQNQDDEEDILAAFNSSAPVDASTNFPVPDQSRSSSRAPSVPPTLPISKQPQNTFLDDDDPFGLGTAPATQSTSNTGVSREAASTRNADDDDVLGLLGKPVSELPPPRSPSPPPSTTAEAHPVDKAIAELVDMGFSAEKSQEALAATESGLDVQSAVGWLLNQAHTESRSKSQTPLDRRSQSSKRDPTEADGSSSGPAWMRQPSRPSAPRQRSGSSQSPGPEKDAAKYASELGNNLFKTANSLWKSGQKKFNKAVADFNTENDSSQPKWMKDASTQKEVQPPQRRRSLVNGNDARANSATASTNMTDEAILLEIGRERPPPAKSKTKVRNPAAPFSEAPPIVEDSKPVLPHRVQQRPEAFTQPRSKVTRQMNEEEPIQAYVSPARRKKPAPKAQPQEQDLLFGASESSRTVPQPVSSIATPSPHSQRPAVTRPSAPLPSRPKAPPRNVPSISSIALKSSTSHRIAGTAAFKLGNYSDAASSYTAALRDVPQEHPLVIVLLTNRALTHLKTGDPKLCIADADAALQVIGPSKGADESIDFGGDEGKKDMAPYWGKAMMRRAEALEQLERWIDAGKIWRECVEAGVGGNTSIQGRTRCDKATGHSASSSQPASRKATPVPKKPTPKPNAPRASALDDLSGRPSLPHAPSSEAVTRLRAANEAAAKADNEKFALSDSVANRVDQWRKGKESNLRALLGSLDTVLWSDSGWKKIGMSELLNPNKVKINYMKGIAKVHPDKVSGL